MCIRLFLTLILFAWLIAGIGCQPRSHEKVADFTFDENRYRNKFFGFSLSLPETWHVTVGNGTLAYFLDAETASGGDRELKRDLEQAGAWSHPLLGTSPEAPGLPGDVPQLIVVAEDMRFQTDRSPKAALLLIRDTIRRISPEARFPDKPTRGELGGRSFTVMRVEHPVEDLVVKSFIYVTVERGYALCFTVFYLDGNQFRDLQPVLHSIRF